MHCAPSSQARFNERKEKWECSVWIGENDIYDRSEDWTWIAQAIRINYEIVLTRRGHKCWKLVQSTALKWSLKSNKILLLFNISSHSLPITWRDNSTAIFFFFLFFCLPYLQCISFASQSHKNGVWPLITVTIYSGKINIVHSKSFVWKRTHSFWWSSPIPESQCWVSSPGSG